MEKLQYKEIKQTFIDFLKAHDAFTKFVVCLCHHKNKDWYIAANGSVNRTFSAHVSAFWSGKIGTRSMWERHYRMELLIIYAFSWSDTSGGGINWRYLSDEWSKVLYDKYEVFSIMYKP